MAETLRLDVLEYLDTQGIKPERDVEVVINVWWDAQKVAGQYISSGILPRGGGLQEFRQGFHSSPELTMTSEIPESDRGAVTGEKSCRRTQ